MTFSFKSLDKDLYVIEKNYVVKTANHGSDVSGPYWMLMEVTIVKGSMWHICDGNKIYPPGNHFYIYVPPFSWSVEHYAANTEIKLRGLISKTPVKTSFKNPIIFSAAKNSLPEKLSSVSAFIDGAKNAQDISACSAPSALSSRAKNILDKEFNNGIEVQEIAERLKTSNAVLSRSFKKDFGHPLAFYKKGLRITVGMYELMMGNSPVKAAALAGYNDLGRFYKQFKQYLKQTPTEYLEKSKNAKK